MNQLSPGMPLRDKLMLLRHHACAKWQDVARAIGIPAHLLCKFTTGRRRFPLKVVDDLADAFGVHRAWLKDDAAPWPPVRTFGKPLVSQIVAGADAACNPAFQRLVASLDPSTIGDLSC